MKYVYIATPAKSGMPDGSLAKPFRIESAYVEFTHQNGDPEMQRQVEITNRSGSKLRLDIDAVRALGWWLAEAERAGWLQNGPPAKAGELLPSILQRQAE